MQALQSLVCINVYIAHVSTNIYVYAELNTTRSLNNFIQNSIYESRLGLAHVPLFSHSECSWYSLCFYFCQKVAAKYGFAIPIH